MTLGIKEDKMKSVSGAMTSVYCSSSKATIGNHNTAATKILAPNPTTKLLIM